MATQSTVPLAIPVHDMPLVEGALEPLYHCMARTCVGEEWLADELFVPPVDWLYRVVRGTEVDWRKPLTEEEVARHARCSYHGFETVVGLEHNRREGIKHLYPMSATLRIMAEARQRNAHKCERQRFMQRSEREIDQILAAGGKPYKKQGLGRRDPRRVAQLEAKRKKREEAIQQKGKKNKQNGGGKKRH